MTSESRCRTFLVISVCLLAAIPRANAQYAGGAGLPEDPYQIATAADLIALGQTPDDYDKHFILTADIDLDPNLPGRKLFDRAVIAPDANDAEDGFQGTPFTGVFDGNDHTVSDLVIMGEDFLGLFGTLGDGAMVLNLGLEAVEVSGGSYVGGLAAHNDRGHIAACHSTGTVGGTGSTIGGFVGFNSGRITACHNSGTVAGGDLVGGLVGANFQEVRMSYSTGTVTGNDAVGGLVGENDADPGLTGADGSITTSSSGCTVSGTAEYVGGLVGRNSNARITNCYSSGPVSGPDKALGGLVGRCPSSRHNRPRTGTTVTSFWDIQTSGQTASGGGTGLTTDEMQDMNTYLNAGWDFVDEIQNGTCDYWQMSPGDYPRLRSPVMPEGFGTAEQPYLIRDALDLGTVWFQPMACYRLEASIDLSGVTWSMPVIPRFDGTLDGNGFTISSLHIEGEKLVGLVGLLGHRGRISDLGLDAVDVNGTDEYVGGLAGLNYGCIADSYSTGAVAGDSRYVGGLAGGNDGSITTSHSTATVSGSESVGGLVGGNDGSITTSHSAATVSGSESVGGLVGLNADSIAASYSAGMATGDRKTGGLVGANDGAITTSYSTAAVSGNESVGGLVGVNWGSIVTSYSAGSASGTEYVGGLIGNGHCLYVRNCVWDVEASGLSASTGGMGLTSGEMMDPYMLGLNGFANDPNWLLDEGRDYPRLAWEDTAGQAIPEPDIDWFEGNGTEDDPYRVETADQLIRLAEAPILLDRYFVLCADINLDPNLPNGRLFDRAVIPEFFGSFDGHGHTISHMTIAGDSYLGLFGRLFGEVKDLAVVNVSVTGSGSCLGGLVGCSYDASAITGWSTGTVSGDTHVGGLVGSNRGSITASCSTAAVSGSGYVAGGLVGENGSGGSISASFSTGTVTGNDYVGGLVGDNDSAGTINASYSTGTVSGNGYVGGLVASNWGHIIASYSTGSVTGAGEVGGLIGHDAPWSGGHIAASFWDVETSGQAGSAGGTGLTTAEMQTAATFLDAGWDFVDETDNGIDDIWWIDEDWDYPHLWWQLPQDDPSP